LLRFALEIKEELGEVSNDPKDIAPATVEKAVTNYIFGGHNVIAGTAQNFSQIGSIQISQGDLVAFADALKTLGIGREGVEEATEALVADGKPSERSLGERATEWLKSVGSKLGDAGLKIGTVPHSR
jgi:hypothetical protein